MAQPPSAQPSVARYIDRADEADAFLASLAGSTAIALDTEGASFHRFVDRIYLLQISTRDQDVIIDPLAAGPLAALGQLVSDPRTEIVLHDADYDLRLLRQDYGCVASNIFDTRVAAQLLGIRSFGLGALLERYFAVQLEKKYQRADWSLRPLTPGMLEYAVLDTHYLLRLRDKMHAELVALGRWEWGREEFVAVETEHAAAERDDGSGAFLRIKGARDLTRRELAVLRELAAWRDSVARRLDRATFRVAGNDILLQLAHEQPKTIDELTRIRVVPRVLTERNGREILDAVAVGLRVPEAELPMFARAQRWDRDPGFDERAARLRAIRDAAAARLDMEPGVLCSRERLDSIARAQPRSLRDLESVPALRRWQIEALGPELQAELQS